MPRSYRMPSLDRASYLAAILEGAQIHAVAEVRSSGPQLRVACDRRDLDDAIRCMEPQAQPVFS